jgi:peptide/nickel transport system substrate-binding protein
LALVNLWIKIVRVNQIRLIPLIKHRLLTLKKQRTASRLPFLVAVFLALLAGAGCQLIQPPNIVPPEPPPTPTLPPLAYSVDLTDNAIVVPIAIDPPSFNAYLNDTGFESLVGELVFGALAEIGPDGSYYPELAAELPTLTNGGLSGDGRVVTWRLRPGVLWSDGEPFTSADVKFTWEALRDSGIWAPGFDIIETVETPDPLTAVVKYREFYPNYLIQFGGLGTGVLPAHHCGNINEMLLWDCNLEPVSTGPYILAQWIPGVRLVFEPNPNYYIPDRPLTNQLIFEIEPDPDLRQRNLVRGNYFLDLWPDDVAIQRMADSGVVNIIRTDPARFVLRLALNLSERGSEDPNQPHPVLSNPQVRQAVYHAVDVGYLNAEAFNNWGRPVQTELFQLDCDIPPFHDYNLGLAQALLDDAGWVVVNPDPDSDELPVRQCQGCGTAKDGTPLTLKSYTYIEFGEEMEKAHQLMKEMLAEAGIQLELEAVEGGKLWNTWQNEGIEVRGDFDMNLWDDGYFGVDPTVYLTNMYDPRGIPTRDNPIAGLNTSRYRNQKLPDIFDALHTPIPNNRRRALLCEVALTLFQDKPQIPLLAFPDRYGIHIDIQGVAPHIYDTVTWNAADWQLVPPVDQ